MDLDVVFLGTSGSTPTAQRAPAATLIRRGGDRLLVDCAEGTQRQLLRSSVGLPDVEDIFLTHFHADHYLGLPGMLKTFSLRGREVPIAIHGPAGLRELFGDQLPGRHGRPVRERHRLSLLEPAALRPERDAERIRRLVVEPAGPLLLDERPADRADAVVERDRPHRVAVALDAVAGP